MDATVVRRVSSTPEDEVAKKLFSSSPKSREKCPHTGEDEGRRDVWAYKKAYKNGGAKARPRMGCCGAFIFFSLCLTAFALTLYCDSGQLSSLTTEDVYRFFSNELLQYSNATTSRMFYFHGKHLMGLGALQLALALGIFCAVFTCLFMFYDSDIPGNFPPTPVSSPSRNQKRVAPSTSRWHLGYIFVPVNCFVTFSLALFYFRWHMGLPLL